MLKIPWYKSQVYNIEKKYGKCRIFHFKKQLLAHFNVSEIRIQTANTATTTRRSQASRHFP